ncbi:MAG: UDPGP type 1 family protein [Pirellulales bacterium]|nr:UDPGP type 1 family protein [Pirellulales bacterium]
MNREDLQPLLAAHGQDHVLKYWDELSDRQRQHLAAQIQSVDLELMATLTTGQAAQSDVGSWLAQAGPPPAILADGSGATWSRQEAWHCGEEVLRSGHVGAVLVAGGQGTRLGFDLPKGMFPIGPVSQRTLFQMFADRLRAISQRYGVGIPLYLMTSDTTDQPTRDYFEQQDYLGLSREEVHIFRQGTMPAVDAETGKLLLAAKDSLALSPDGHGGTVAALKRSGCLADAQRRDLRYLSYIQIDNPLAALCDPALIGHHMLSGSEMTTQVIRKRYPTEKVGNVISAGGHVRIIEYSDLPESAAQATMPNGSLKLWAGNIAVHVLDVGLLARMAGQLDCLPFHRAHKKVAHVGQDGQLIHPEQPNAIKFERFIFDLLPAADNAFVVEAMPEDAFAPVKNADGSAADTPALAKAALSALHRRWLESAGAVVDQGVSVEINPLFSLWPEDLREKIPSNLQISSDQYFDG